MNSFFKLILSTLIHYLQPSAVYCNCPVQKSFRHCETIEERLNTGSYRNLLTKGITYQNMNWMKKKILRCYSVQLFIFNNKWYRVRWKYGNTFSSYFNHHYAINTQSILNQYSMNSQSILHCAIELFSVYIVMFC